MTRSKKIFTAFAVVFFLFLAFVVYDISSRTTFPGSKPAKKELPPVPHRDSVTADSIVKG